MINILVVDDQPHLQELISLELMDEGYKIHSVTDAESVNEYLENSVPDLVLLDLYLDGFLGWDVLNDIKSKYPHLPVIIVTAYDNYTGDPRLSKADGYIIKNFDVIERLKEKVADLVNSMVGDNGSAFHSRVEETGQRSIESRRLGGTV
jgi:CheY-like chemotaxis protein